MSDYFDKFIEAVVKDPVAAIGKLEVLLRAACTCGNAAANVACHLTPEEHQELLGAIPGTASVCSQSERTCR